MVCELLIPVNAYAHPHRNGDLVGGGHNGQKRSRRVTAAPTPAALTVRVASGRKSGRPAAAQGHVRVVSSPDPLDAPLFFQLMARFLGQFIEFPGLHKGNWITFYYHIRRNSKEKNVLMTIQEGVVTQLV